MASSTGSSSPTHPLTITQEKNTSVTDPALEMATDVAQPKMANLRKRRFPYTPVACEKCQRRKIKCSGENPCKGCREGEHECVYLRSTRFRSSRRFSQGTSTQSSEEPGDKDAWQPPEVTTAPTPRRRAVDSAATGLSGRLGDSDYYIRLAERRLFALSPEENHPPRQCRSRISVSSDVLRDLVNCRRKPGAVLATLDVEYWMEVIDIYEEEIGLQYPFLDIRDLKQRIKTAKQSGDAARSPDSGRIEDIALAIHVIVSILADHDAMNIVDSTAEEMFAEAMGRSQLNGAEKDELSVIILTSIYFFLTDKEIRAWRGISVVMRLIQEQVCRAADDTGTPMSSQLENIGEKMYWSVYTLDRRWSFGTGMPFAVQDSDISQHPNLPDDSLSSAYLKNMVAYCNIASEVRKSVLNSCIKQPTVSESTRDFLNFRVIQWQRNLPARLQFSGANDKLDESKERRGNYKLRLMLYLRANQMRTLIYRKLAVQADQSHVSPSSANVMVDVAQDTLRVLIGLARETNIYHAQHKTFNHFLETALSSLLLVICCEGATQTVSCLTEVVAAIELVQQLSTQSPITRKLGNKLQGIRDVVRGLQSQTRGSAIASSSNEHVHTASNGQGNVQDDLSRPLTHLPNNQGRIMTRSSPLVPNTAIETTQTDVPGTDQASLIQPNELDSQGGSHSRNFQAFPPTSESIPFDMHSIPANFDIAQATQFLNDTRGIQFPELEDILRDYDYFGF